MAPFLAGVPHGLAINGDNNSLRTSPGCDLGRQMVLEFFSVQCRQNIAKVVM
tara:strand:- start:695 stop:850 length:156 start_codon:yes stop_codon:yes gene_type:complete